MADEEIYSDSSPKRIGSVKKANQETHSIEATDSVSVSPEVTSASQPKSGDSNSYRTPSAQTPKNKGRGSHSKQSGQENHNSSFEGSANNRYQAKRRPLPKSSVQKPNDIFVGEKSNLQVEYTFV